MSRIVLRYRVEGIDPLTRIVRKIRADKRASERSINALKRRLEELVAKSRADLR